MIINTAPDEFYFATNGSYSFRVSAKVPEKNITAPATIDRGEWVNGKWIMTHRINGDDIMRGGYDLSAAAANNQAGTVVPLGRGRGPASGEGDANAPTVTRVAFYHYR